MSMSPKVSIVILNFNSFKDTKECLLSLQKLEYSNYEIIVVDNSSTDGSYEKLKKEFNTYNIIKSNENLGYANGNNIGIKYALENKADYICVLNNDVIVEDDFLDKIIKVMEDDKDIGLAGPCICKYHDKNIIQAMGANINLYNGLTQGKYKNYKYSDIPQKDIQVDYLGGACFVCRREVFEKIGFIPENYFLFFEETEFCYKASRRGYKLLCVYESKIYHKGSSTISKYSGLSYYFLNRNRVVFIRRNANFFEKCIFSIYIFIEAIARIILRREPLTLLKNIIHGFKADVKSIDMEMVKSFFS
ncbi:glycosyltransferase family 2 protein [Clostridium arbusti]|uniref:glycosyltransferase family 2 protein n=1 Tax=Clostridium arbusti TaxID=1137848 RepID=UPI0002887F28|nr:glycosyltransferase family 2 protein [Clostridium arbusti]